MFIYTFTLPLRERHSGDEKYRQHRARDRDRSRGARERAALLARPGPVRATRVLVILRAEEPRGIAGNFRQSPSAARARFDFTPGPAISQAEKIRTRAEILRAVRRVFAHLIHSALLSGDAGDGGIRATRILVIQGSKKPLRFPVRSRFSRAARARLDGRSSPTIKTALAVRRSARGGGARRQICFFVLRANG